MSTGKWSSTSPIDSYSTSKKVAVMLLDKFLLDSISAVHSAENVEKAPRRILPNRKASMVGTVAAEIYVLSAENSDPLSNVPSLIETYKKVQNNAV